MGDFVHLHLHSEYSLLDGACRIADIPAAVKAAGHDAVAITDHGVMYGVVAFYKACADAGIKPIIGCEVYVAARSMTDKTHELDAQSTHLVLLVKNETGYKNLIKLVSDAFTVGFYSKPRVDYDALEKHSEGLIALSACLAGAIPRALSAGDTAEARKCAQRFVKIFGRDNFYIELQNHGLAEQKAILRPLLSLAREVGVGLVATNDVHYLKKSDADNQAVLLCIQTNSVVTEGRPIGFETDEFYYKSTDEMRALFGEYEGAIENTVKIAERCNFRFEFGELRLPRYKPDNGESPADFLRSLTLSGLGDRLSRGHIPADADIDTYKSRIDYELSVIDRMGYSEYFLIVWDFVHWSKQHGIPVGPGRGSGAGSLVAYLIGITDIDPIRYDLLFERFLNPERVSMPDFDIDFCYDRRDEAIEHVRDKYGADHTAQIITFGTLAARAAVRDVGRALGMSYGDVDAIAKLIPQSLGMTLEKALREKRLRDEYDADPDVKRLIDTAAALEGMPRHASTHAAGVVITEDPVDTYIPLAVNNGVAVTQFPMETVAELGLLKFDFLALRYLTILSDAEKQVRRRVPDFDLSRIPTDDEATYRLISEGKTEGVFQLESPGMKGLLTQLCPRNLDDIVAAIALYRPGPMDSIPAYLENRRDMSKIKYRTPLLKSILDVTCGCIIYQEQVMRIFREVAGFSLGHADIIRRAMSKKKAGVMEAEREAFIAGAAKNGVPRDAAEDLFDDMASFASYAFNKSHAAAYALISYRTAYLKRHYPAEYIAALLTSVLGSPPKIAEYMDEAKRFGITVLPPNINESGVDFSVSPDGKSIRFGLLALKNIGKQFAMNVVAKREIGGKYVDFADFLARIGDVEANKRMTEALVKAGAFDCLVKRSQLVATWERQLEAAEAERRIGLTGQLGLGGTQTMKYVYPDVPEFPVKELLLLEKEASGLYFSGHILDGYSAAIGALGAVPIGEITGGQSDDADVAGDDIAQDGRAFKDGESVAVAGIVTRRINKATKSGDRMAFITLEDKTGEIEVIAFPRTLTDYGWALESDSVVAVNGTLQYKEDDAPKLLLRRAVPLKENGANVEKSAEPAPVKQETAQAGTHARKLYVRLPSLDCPTAKKLLAFAVIFSGADELYAYDCSASKYVRLTQGVCATEFVLRELRELLGEDNVVLK